MKKIVVGTFLFFLSHLANAQSSITDDQVNQSALKETQDVITDPARRIEVVKGSPRAQKIDDQVKQLMGHNAEDMYKTAADFLPYILQMGHGDPTKMVEFLTKATRDPASFANNLPPELKRKASDLAEKVKPLPEQRRP